MRYVEKHSNDPHWLERRKAWRKKANAKYREKIKQTPALLEKERTRRKLRTRTSELPKAKTASQQKRNNLSPAYVAYTMRLPVAHATNSLIQLKRTLILLKRAIGRTSWPKNKPLPPITMNSNELNQEMADAIERLKTGKIGHNEASAIARLGDVIVRNAVAETKYRIHAKPDTVKYFQPLK